MNFLLISKVQHLLIKQRLVNCNASVQQMRQKNAVVSLARYSPMHVTWAFVLIWQNGLASGAPYVLMWATMVGSGMMADMLQKKKILSTTNVRKLANILGKWNG